MPSISALTRLLCMTAACAAFLGCGKVNDQAPVLGSSNKHPDSWLTGHRSVYRQNPDQCRECHGTELLGGVTKVDCFNQKALGTCHANGHGPRAIIHAVPFSDPALHGVTAKKDLTICQDCHGTAGGAGSSPRFNLAYGSLPAGCESAGCHKVRTAHPKPWKTHGSAGNQSNACALCHGAGFEGSAASGSPSCKSCHAQLAAGLVPVAGQCASCHGNPPNGTVTPNRAGSHAVHLALPGMAGNCSACHSGGGSGSAAHSSTLTLVFASAVSTSPGTASFNGTACSSISCHGGMITPVWGGSLDVLANCTSCHQSAAAYPGYHSGQHALHLGKGLACTDCHDMTNQSAHFGNVMTTVFETQPGTTMRGFLTYNQAVQSCSVSNPPPAGVQFTGCHGGTETWQ